MRPSPLLLSSYFLVCDQEARIVANCTPMIDAAIISFPAKEAAENAAFIVQACNSHDDLVAALTGLLDEGLKSTGDKQADDEVHHFWVSQARAALKRAKGEA